MIETTSIELMNAYVAEVVAYNRTLIDELMLAKAQLTVAETEAKRLQTLVDMAFTKELTPNDPSSPVVPSEAVVEKN